jgi:ABC-type glycerol-3-phosphate transport system permease component
MLKSNVRPANNPYAISFSHRLRLIFRDWHLNLILGILAIITYVPLVVVLFNSFKDTRQFFTQFWLPQWPLHLDGYSRAWPTISENLINTVIYTAPTVVITLIVSALTGYAFARYRFPGREVLFFLILLIIMLPGILLVIPMFTQIVSWNWQNSVQSIVLPYSAVQVPLGMFLMRTFFETLPANYFEAARIDGANEMQLFNRIALPLALPAFATLAIITLLFSWNDIIWPLIALFDNHKYPISIGVLAFNTTTSTDYGATFAAYVMASLPLLLLFSFTARRFMAGLSGGISL